MTDPPGAKGKRIMLLATGGTIASTGQEGGGAVARLGAGDLVAEITPDGVEVETRDVLTLGSYLLEHSHLRQIAEAVDVAIPKLRSGSYSPEWLLERRRRAVRG